MHANKHANKQKNTSDHITSLTEVIIALILVTANIFVARINLCSAMNELLLNNGAPVTQASFMPTFCLNQLAIATVYAYRLEQLLIVKLLLLLNAPHKSNCFYLKKKQKFMHTKWSNCSKFLSKSICFVLCIRPIDSLWFSLWPPTGVYLSLLDK